MPNVWYPPAVRDPGINVGYHAGRTPMVTAVCHYTVGRDSRPIGRQGYFHFLISRDGQVTQFCEADAVAWHAGDPWNGRGPGIEVEYLDEPDIFTPEAADACGRLNSWLSSEWGIPLNFYDGPRRSDWAGFITHRSLIQTGDSHSDYWPYLPTGAAPPLPPMEDTMWLILDTATQLNWLATANAMIQVPGDQVVDLVASGIKRYDVNSRTVQWLGKVLHEAPAGGGGAVPLKVTLTGTATP